jgi:hypothetical protein
MFYWRPTGIITNRNADEIKPAPPMLENGRAAGSDLRQQRPAGLEEAVTFDALRELRHGGHPVELLTTAQQGVLAELTEAEVAVLNSVRERLEAAADHDVEGHSALKTV